jgi:hypothetical protein
MKRLIGIAGKAGSGKDTVADYLGIDHGFHKIAFADPLRLAAQSMFGVDRRHFIDRDLKESVHPDWGISPRRMLQLLGNDAVKPIFGPDIWIRRWSQSYNVVRHTDHVVVPDTRFDLEAEHVRAAGGVILHVTRPGASLEGEAGQHSSEKGVTFRHGDILLVNDGSLDELYGEVDMLLASLADLYGEADLLPDNLDARVTDGTFC